MEEGVAPSSPLPPTIIASSETQAIRTRKLLLIEIGSVKKKNSQLQYWSKPSFHSIRHQFIHEEGVVMNGKLMATLSAVCMVNVFAACGNPVSPVDTIDGPDDIVTLKSFAVSQGLLEQGSNFRMTWNTSSSVPTIGSLYLSHSQDHTKDSKSRHIMTLTCGSYSACEWNGEAVCGINANKQLTCTDPVTEKKSESIGVDSFQGDVYLVFEACAALDCKTSAQKITIR